MVIVHKLNKLIKNIVNELKAENKIFSSFKFLDGGKKFSLKMARKTKGHNNNINHIECDIVFQLKKFSFIPYIELAEEIKKRLIKDSMVKDVTIDRYGLLHIVLNEKDLVSVVNEVIKKAYKYGQEKKNNIKVNIEYTSASPLNSLTLMNARNALVGETIARILEYLGYQVTREFLVYPGLKKMEKVSQIVHEQYVNLFELNDNSIKVDKDILECAKNIKAQNGDLYLDINDTIKRNKFDLAIVFYFLNKSKKQLKNLGVFFDIVSYFEDILVKEKIDKVLELLSPFIYDNDSNLILNTNLDDSKERILVHRNGTSSYLLLDIIYHLEKLKRADWIIDILDANHTQYSHSLISALKFLNAYNNNIDIDFCENFQIKENNEVKSMTEKNQNVIFIDELVKKVNLNEIKFFFLEKSTKHQITIEKEILNQKKISHNFDFILNTYNKVNKLLDESKNNKCYCNKMNQNNFLSKLILRLDYFPYVLRKVIKTLNPFYLTKYLKEMCYLINQNLKDKLKKDYRNFYPILEAVKNVFDNGLNLLGIDFKN